MAVLLAIPEIPILQISRNQPSAGISGGKSYGCRSSIYHREALSMKSDPKQPETLLSVSTEIEAAAIANALVEHGIEALTVGGHTSGFKAEAPGSVAVVVKQADFDRARNALSEVRQQQGAIDWSKVEVTEKAETPQTAQNGDTLWSLLTIHIWWMLEFMGIGLCVIHWWYTDHVSHGLAYAFMALALAGLFLASFPFADRRRTVKSFAVSQVYGRK
jgi:hypothetical protein